MAVRAVDQGALAARLAGLALPKGGFTAPARARALARLNAMGLPQPRDEYWRYTSPALLNDAVTHALAAMPANDLFSQQKPLRVVFTDGRFDAAASDDLAASGLHLAPLHLAPLHLAPLSVAGQADLHFAQDLYGTLEERGQTPIARPFAALNTAFAPDGILVHVTGPAPRAISVFYQGKTNASDVMLHHCIKLDAGASLTVLEQGSLGARGNLVWEMDLAAGATLHHIRTQIGGADTLSVSHIFARLAAEARLKSFTFAANGRLMRNESVVELLGDAASAHLAGAILAGAHHHHDETVFITHQGRTCESRQVFKNVLRGGAVGVFQGKILVKQSAQKTDGYQISQALLLDGDAQFLAKPELEIYADDVKCSHGSTSGAINEGALFYLQSRGVPRAEAQALLVLAFLGEAMDEIDDPALADELRDLAQKLLAEAG